jgi:predicted glycosyltransferase
LLARADASISLCGYNTAMDVLQTGRPAVFVPFDDGSEVEQTLRADRLAQLPGIEVLRSADLSEANLLQSLRAALAAPARLPRREGFNGAAESARICMEYL